MSVLALLLAAVLPAPPVPSGNECNPPSIGPDVIVGNLTDVYLWGTVNDVSGYSLGSDACNVGDDVVPWYAIGTDHPLIAQNMYRLKDGRFEQIGMSWAKHGWGAAALSLCCTCNNPGTYDLLGVGCSDPYTAGTNGDQDGFGGGAYGGLGPRSEVNPADGVFLFPYGSQGMSGDATYKRCQVKNEDVDPSLNPGAVYFGEVQYVTPHDAQAGNGLNNASYRQMKVDGPSGNGWAMSLADVTRRKLPAIHGWKELDPAVELSVVDVPADGRFTLGARVTEVGGGWWRYSYALHNQTSNRAAGLVAVPVPAGVAVQGVGFHDVDSHSGEPYSNDDWPGQALSDRVEWASVPHATDPNANALRWGTVYSYWFEAAAPPVPGAVAVGLFAPGSPDSVSFSAPVPGDSPCGVTSYCVAAPNSAGAGAVISAGGSTSLAANDLELHAAGAVPGQFGLYFYGPDAAQQPFGDGFLCVSGGFFRLSPAQQATGAGAIDRAVDLTQPPMSGGAGEVLAGSTWRFQLWYRDPAGPGGAGFNLSDALEAVFCP
jgi:hypothetical protein